MNQKEDIQIIQSQIDSRDANRSKGKLLDMMDSV